MFILMVVGCKEDMRRTKSWRPTSDDDNMQVEEYDAFK